MVWSLLAAGLVVLAIGLVVANVPLPRLATRASPGTGGQAGDPTAVADVPMIADLGGQRGAPGVSPSASEAPVLSISGRVPQQGTGEFAMAGGAGPVLGRSGTLRRFRVAVERGSDEDAREVADLIDETLGDPRGWTGDGRTRLQRVSAGSPAEFTIYLATGGTTQRMCLAGGVDVRVNGTPYTSCRATGKVILNLNRWRLSVPEYVERAVPLHDYRQYVINHEVGHQLGHGHEQCPKRGKPAPVMVQQTLSLQGCRPYSWPRLDGERYAGPPVV